MQATQLPCKMMQGMRLGFVHSAARSTPPYFVVNVMKIIVQSLLSHKLVGTRQFSMHKKYHSCCAKGIHRFLSCCVVCRQGVGVDSGLLVVFLYGRVKLGLKSGYLAQK